MVEDSPRPAGRARWNWSIRRPARPAWRSRSTGPLGARRTHRDTPWTTW